MLGKPTQMSPIRAADPFSGPTRWLVWCGEFVLGWSRILTAGKPHKGTSAIWGHYNRADRRPKVAFVCHRLERRRT